MNFDTFTLSEFNSMGVALSPEPDPTADPPTYGGFSGGGLNDPGATAVDGSGNVWAVGENYNSAPYSISKFSSSGQPLSPDTGYTGGGLDRPVNIAIDHSGNAWVADNFNGTISEFDPSGNPLSSTGYTGGGLLDPIGLAIDGLGRVWVSNYYSIVVLDSGGNPLSGSDGYQYENSAISDSPLLAIDGSGNVWLQSYGSVPFAELVGAAAPVVTPLAAGVANNTLGTRP